MRKAGPPNPNHSQYRHGLRRTPEYTVWANMKNRTSNPKCKEYSYYGGRGITVCREWQQSFLAFYLHIGPRPSPKHQLDRYPNPDGNYEPSNVRWATKSEQMLNRRNASRLSDGQTERRASEWAKVLGISESTIHRRKKRGLPIEKILFTGIVSRQGNAVVRGSARAATSGRY